MDFKSSRQISPIKQTESKFQPPYEIGKLGRPRPLSSEEGEMLAEAFFAKIFFCWRLPAAFRLREGGEDKTFDIFRYVAPEIFPIPLYQLRGQHCVLRSFLKRHDLA